MSSSGWWDILLIWCHRKISQSQDLEGWSFNYKTVSTKKSFFLNNETFILFYWKCNFKCQRLSYFCVKYECEDYWRNLYTIGSCLLVNTHNCQNEVSRCKSRMINTYQWIIRATCALLTTISLVTTMRRSCTGKKP